MYGYNRTPGGMGNTNPTDETRKLQSEIKKEYYKNGGKPNIPTFTDEQRKQQSIRAKNQKNRDITGFDLSDNNRKEVDVYKYKSDEYIGKFESTREACRQLGLPDGAYKHVPQIYSGRRNHVGGYVFKRVRATTQHQK